jgi:hypothetical protein
MMLTWRQRQKNKKRLCVLAELWLPGPMDAHWRSSFSHLFPWRRAARCFIMRSSCMETRRSFAGPVVDWERDVHGPRFSIGSMVNTIRTEEDGWTVITRDGQLPAQFKHTVAVTQNGVRVLTLRAEEKALR